MRIKTLLRKKFICFISYVLIISLIFGLVGFKPARPNTATATVSEPEITQGTPHSFLYIFKIEPAENKIILKGKHNKATSLYRYATDCFVLTKYAYNNYEAFPSKTELAREYIYTIVDDKEDPIDSSTIISTYTIKYDEFMGAVNKLGISGEDIGQGPTRIYLQYVFKTYYGEECTTANTTAKNILGYKEMMEAPKTYNLGYSEWSDRTQEILKDYYNLDFYVNPSSTFKVKIVPVDKDKNKMTGAIDVEGENLSFEGFPKNAIEDDIIKYTMPAKNKTITCNNNTYVYQSKWWYEYTKRGETGTIKTDTSLETNIKFNAPDAVPQSTVTIYVQYDIKKDPYYVIIDAVDKNRAFIKNLDTKKYPVYYDEVFKYDVPSDWFTISNNYKYQYKWYLEYTNKSGSKVIRSTEYQEDISFPMPDAKPGTTARFCLSYDKAVVTAPPTPTPGPVTPTPIPEATPTLAPQVVIVPESDAASLEFTEVVNTAVINPDIRHSERFISTLGVPTTESLYGQVTARDYLLGYSFVKKVGIKYFPVTVTKYYTLSYYTATPDEAGGKKLVTKTTSVSQTISVPRAYGYWEILNFDCYKIDNAVLKNYALPDGSITLTPNYTYYNPPTVGIYHSDQMDYHVMPPDEAVYGISLYESLSSSGSTMPSIKSEDFTSVALARTGKAKVRSDYLSFNNTTIISDSICETEAPDINELAIPQCKTFINENVLYKPEQIIEAKKLNGKYDSSGVITYTAIARINSTVNEKPQYNIEGINDVVIHTPVVCNPQITADNDKYVQLINPTKDCIQLVLDPDDRISDFSVYISNYGPHSNKLGYYTRDFSRCLRDPTVSYIAQEDSLLLNQVKFPFDVYQDTGRSFDCSDDTFIKAGTWITMSRNTLRFYLPMTVNEGVYTANFRTIAVNGMHLLNKTEVYANTELYHYVATNTVNFEVSGRIYGLTVYDISDYPLWKEIFRVPNSTELKKNLSKYANGTALTTYDKGLFYNYTVGTNDQYGNDTGRNVKYTFPLINGSHPQYKNMGILKSGYMVRFSLETTGNMFSDACMVNIKPNFYYVDKNSKNRTAVDLYYTEEINGKSRNLVKVGSALDKINLKSVKVGDLNLGIPEVELKQTARLRGVSYDNLTSKSLAMFNFSEIRLNWGFRTYVNNQYLNKIKSYTSFEHLLANKITESSILERLQRWYGQYYIPNRVHAVKKDFDVMDYADKYGVDDNESFWLDDGYIIVNFTIETVSDDGKRRLSYINAANYQNKGHCSMWVMEGAPQTKSSFKGPSFNFYAGDFMIYYTDKKMSDDYKTGAIY